MAGTNLAIKEKYIVKSDELLHSTKELLTNYKSIKAAVQAASLFSSNDRDELIEVMSDMVNAPKSNVVSLVGTAERQMSKRQKTNTVLMTQVEKALMVLEKIPTTGKMLYDVINITYIQDNTLTCDEDRAEELGISRPTFLKRKKEAINAFNAIIWGTDDIFDIMSKYSSITMR